jgi:hypothetical protein
MTALFSQLQGTEDITKFLRNKDTEVIDIYKFTVEKLFGNANGTVYLPQKEKFVLELLVDRISQNNKLAQKFRYSEKTWALFNFIWNQCNNDQRLLSIRSKILSKVKFGEIFSKLLDDIIIQELYKNEILINEFTITISYLIKNSKVYLSDDQNLSIVKNLLNLFVKENFSNELSERLLTITISIFDLNNKATFKYDTKHKTEFSRFCLANVLSAIGKYDDDDDNKLKLQLKSVIVKTLFSDADSNNIITFIEGFSLLESNKFLNANEVLYLLKLIIPKVNINNLETIVKLLISAFPAYSSILLKEVTDMNKTLSSEFLSISVEKALQSKDDESYDLIIHSIKRNTDVAIKFTDQICELCCLENSNSICLFKELIDSYFKSREIESFIKLWTKVVNENSNSLFESDEIISYVASKLITLSYTQLSRFVEIEIDMYKSSPERNQFFLLAVCKGLLKGVSGSIQNSLSKTLIQNLFQLKSMLVTILKVENKFVWKLKYSVLSLFDVEDISEEVGIITKIKAVDDDYYYYSMLRIIEQDVNKVDVTFIKKFKSYFKKKSSNVFKTRIFSRFFMTIEAIFSNDDISLFVNLLVETASDEELSNILKNRYFQAQPKLISMLIEHLINTSKGFSNLQIVSVYAFNKSQRENILNLMINNLDEPNTKFIIQNLLQLPTYKSKLETDAKSLIKLSSKNDTTYDGIIKKIIKFHLIQPIESEKYLISLVKELSTMFDTLSMKNVSYYFDEIKVTLILIKESIGTKFENKTNELFLLALEKIKTIISNPSKLSVDDICLLLSFMTEINFVNPNITTSEDIKDIIFNISSAYYDNSVVKNCLFKYICSLGNFYKTQYIIALYIVLGNKENKCPLEKYLSLLSENENLFIGVWFNICESIELSKPTDFGAYIELLTYIIESVKRPNDSKNFKLVYYLFVSSISHVFNRITDFNEYSSELDSFLKCLKNVTSTKIWIFTQYSTELTMAFITFISKNLQIQDTYIIKKTYIILSQIISSIVLYQRHRLSNRHHLIITVLISLMKTLFVNSKVINDEGGLAFKRLISNFCEPNIQTLTVKHSENIKSKDAELNNALSQTKSGLRKHVPILVFNYIKFYLQYQIDLSIKQHLDNSVYMMLDLLTLNELNYINKSLDNQGRLVFRNIYEDYKKFFKWNEE